MKELITAEEKKRTDALEAELRALRENRTYKEPLQVGNAAKMCDALLMVKKLFDGRIMFQPAIREAHKAVNAALSAPRRNCDVGTTEEQAERYMNFCHNYPKCTGCPCVGRVKYNQCEFVWSQMPCESEVKQ